MTKKTPTVTKATPGRTSQESLLAAIEVQRKEQGEDPFPKGTEVRGASFLFSKTWRIYASSGESCQNVIDIIKKSKKYSKYPIEPTFRSWEQLTEDALSSDFDTMESAGPIVVSAPPAPASSLPRRSPRSVTRIPLGSEYRKI